MSLLARIGVAFGRRPKLPEGASWQMGSERETETMRVSGYVYRVRLQPAGQDTPGRQYGPTFTDRAEAARFLDWLEGGPPYVPPPGKAC